MKNPKKVGMFSLLAGIAAAAALVSNAPIANADRPDAPNPGDFAKGSLQCETSVFDALGLNLINMEGTLVTDKNVMLSIYEVRGDELLPLQDDVSMHIALDDVPLTGSSLYIPSGDGAQTVQFTIRPIYSGKSYALVGEYLSAQPNADGSSDKGVLISAAAEWDECLITD